jgi:hypothetical protein
MEKNVYHITEKDQYMPPSSMDLITIADAVGSRLMNMFTGMENIKIAYPDSTSRVDSFINSSIVPINNKIKSFIETEIPKLETITNAKYKGNKSSYKDLGYSVKTVKDKATLEVLLKLKELEKETSDAEKKADEIKKSMSNEYQGSVVSKSLEDSVQAILNKVTSGIIAQAEQNIRKKKRGDIIAGTTDPNDLSASGAAGTANASGSSTKSNASTSNKRKNIANISSYLAKKYKIE